jgi:methyl-accepting chemotaxis protein
MFKTMKLGRKLLIAFLSVGIIPAALVGIAAVWEASSALEAQAFNQLEGMRGVKKGQIEQFFAERQGDMGVLVDIVDNVQENAFSKLEAVQQLKKKNIEDLFANIRSTVRVAKDDPYIGEAFKAINSAFRTSGGRVDSYEWKAAAEKYHSRLKDIMDDNGWYDIFLINPQGDIIYTVTRESDLGLNIPQKLADSSMAAAFEQALKMGDEDVAIGDFKPYAPSNGAQAAFLVGRLSFADGYFAMQLPTDPINTIVQNRSGLRSKTESYLVGELGGISSYRSDRVVKSGNIIGKKKGGSDVEAALAGNTGSTIKVGSTGDVEAVSYAPIEVPGLKWAILTSGSIEEILSAKEEGDERDFFGEYIHKYGYYDLFLIEPSGNVFYTVTKEADYQTNMVNGKYKDSGLGQLTRKVLETKRFGLADFAPYAPSNGAPAGFIAQPVVRNGEVELIIALQLSLEAINKIMQQRDGMGETGETYLVGADKRMRSDSYLDPKGHSVAASFAGTVEQNGIDSESVNKAIAGNEGSIHIIDYNGNPVLSSYTPVKVGDTTWAVIAEIDEVEAFAAVYELEIIMGIIALIAIGAIVVSATLIGRGITRPILSAVETTKTIAAGDLSGTIEITSQDEIGELLQAMKGMQQELSTVIEKDIQGIVDAAGNGNLGKRIDLAGKQGFFASLSSGVNDLVDISERVVDDTVRVFSALARGDLSETITSDYKGAFDQLKRDANATIAKLTEVIEQDIQPIIDAAQAGDLSARIDLAGKQGFFDRLSRGINEMVDVNERIIEDTVRVMGALAEGDLTETIEAEYRGAFDRLKQDANRTVAKLTEVVNEIKESSETVSTASDELSKGNFNLSQRTEEQASSLEETASSMEEMTSVVRQNADNAAQANQLAIGARETAAKGGEVNNRAVAAMSEISSSSRKVVDIISVIDEIAFQTNLLALNASVEAARAGEQGRGFAVVASEVRNLAGRSATAAKEIKELIEDSMSKVEEGSKLVNESGATLEEIVTAVKKVTDNVGEISSATAEQSSGIDQVNKAVMQMDEMTQQNAALVEEATAATQSMSEQAQQLAQMIAFFKTGETTSTSARRHTRPAQRSAPKSAAPKPAPTKPSTAKAGSTAKKVTPAPNDDAGDDWEEF